LYSVGAGQYSNGMFGFVTKLDSLGNPGWLTAYESQLTSSFWWQYFGSVDAGKNGMVAMSGVFGQNAVWPGQGTFAGAGEDHLAAVLFDGTWAPPAFPLDVVWPGDANYDGSVNALDLLSVGVAFASTGPVRPNASLNWQGQPCYDWNGSFASGVNYKHGDTNGDGIINASDTLALELNYSLSPATNTASSGGPLLFTQFAQDSIEVGDTVNLEILLGTASIPANLYGLAFSLHYDSTLIDAESIVAGFQGSWLGMPGTELLTMAQNRPDSSRIDIALTRTDQMPVAGYGLIAHLTIIMVDDLTAKDYLAEPLSFTLGEVYGVDADGNELGFGWESDSIILVEEIIDSTTTHLPGGPSARMALYPQPSDQLLQVNWGPHQATSWKVSDLLGRELMKSQGTFDDLKIPTDQLPAGTYLLQIDTSLGIQAARFRVKHP
ncbi:MAG: T9SS type A sorting domain-containing protein, partial [Bacteroidota bacterium]